VNELLSTPCLGEQIPEGRDEDPHGGSGSCEASGK